MPRGPIQSLPEDLGPRRERFVELDALQAGWEVRLSISQCMFSAQRLLPCALSTRWLWDTFAGA